jgi:hypothetical protein
MATTITKFTITPGAATLAAAPLPRSGLTLYAPTSNAGPVYYALGVSGVTVPTGTTPGLPLAPGAVVTLAASDSRDQFNEGLYVVHGDAGDQLLVVHEYAR